MTRARAKKVRRVVALAAFGVLVLAVLGFGCRVALEYDEPGRSLRLNAEPPDREPPVAPPAETE